MKAAYLYSFGRFVEWPPSAPAVSDESFNICVLGDNPFGRQLEDVVANGSMKEKPVRVRSITRVEDSGVCRTLFISVSEDVRIAKILETLDHTAVLTVSDAPQFAQRGGMIGFATEANRIRFTVNLPATQAAGLSVNSELLRVAARILRDR